MRVFRRIVGIFWIALSIFVFSGELFAKNKAIVLRTGIQPGNVSRFVLETKEKSLYNISYLDNPRRVVIDISNLDVDDVKKDSVKSGFISDVKVSSGDGKTSQIVLHLSNTAKVKKNFVLNPIKDGANYRLVLDLEQASGDEFSKLAGGAKSSSKKENVVEEEVFLSNKKVVNNKVVSNKTSSNTGKKNVKPVNNQSKKIIVIDAGHGGKDPGTIGSGGTYEKTIALALAKQLRDILVKNPNYKVILTRNDDTFIQLQDRAKIAERNNASIFISIHLNSSPNKKTNGFSIYTLSEKATDDEARKIAEKENAADLLGIGSFEGYDTVTKNILGDLLQTQVKIASVELANAVVDQIKKDVACIYHPHREAPFIVLRSSIPSVLIEAGFLSNKDEEKKLNQKWYREKMAYSFARAIDGILAE